ncbi:MAG: helix-turn-helix domain-containing protein [Halanaeroarchaeum sp.]
MPEDPETDDETGEEPSSARERLEEGADKAIGEFDQGVVDLLAWLLDTETRARIYVYLRQHPDSTSEEVASGTGLYPSTVREALAELHDDGTVSRGKRDSEGAGNNPYEYEAISPSELVSGAVGQVQNQLNAVFNLDDRLDRGDEGDDDGPVTISVSDAEGDDDDDGDENAAEDLNDADLDDSPDPAETERE